MKIKSLKTILGIYIILAIILAGLNYGYANKTDSSLAEFIPGSGTFMKIGLKPFSL